MFSRGESSRKTKVTLINENGSTVAYGNLGTTKPGEQLHCKVLEEDELCVFVTDVLVACCPVNEPFLDTLGECVDTHIRWRKSHIREANCNGRVRGYLAIYQTSTSLIGLMTKYPFKNVQIRCKTMGSMKPPLYIQSQPPLIQWLEKFTTEVVEGAMIPICKMTIYVTPNSKMASHQPSQVGHMFIRHAQFIGHVHDELVNQEQTK